ncbi:MAG: hypothetical protein ABI434_18025 [Burkholderiaceae bacterium]
MDTTDRITAETNRESPGQRHRSRGERIFFARITGVGSSLPGPPISNTDLMARGVDTNDDWVISRTGIKTRHIAQAGVTSSDLAFEACLRALTVAEIDAS